MLRQLFDPASGTFSYLLACDRTREAVLIDPVLGQLDRDLRLIDALGAKLRWTVDTHVHADHLTAAAALSRRTGTACSAIGPEPLLRGYDRRLRDGDPLPFGDESLLAIASPGHTPGHLCLLWRDRLFTGDALLIDGCGRTDLPHGDAGQLYDTITERLFKLPDDTLVYPGHDDNGRTFSSIARERLHNPRLAGRSRAAFIAAMAELALPLPQQLEQTLYYNRSAGAALR